MFGGASAPAFQVAQVFERADDRNGEIELGLQARVIRGRGPVSVQFLLDSFLCRARRGLRGGGRARGRALHAHAVAIVDFSGQAQAFANINTPQAFAAFAHRLER